jgi:hypothetical protein
VLFGHGGSADFDRTVKVNSAVVGVNVDPAGWIMGTPPRQSLQPNLRKDSHA